jgi:hypothetical protein
MCSGQNILQNPQPDISAAYCSTRGASVPGVGGGGAGATGAGATKLLAKGALNGVLNGLLLNMHLCMLHAVLVNSYCYAILLYELDNFACCKEVAALSVCNDVCTFIEISRTFCNDLISKLNSLLIQA